MTIVGTQTATGDDTQPAVLDVSDTLLSFFLGHAKSEATLQPYKILMPDLGRRTEKWGTTQNCVVLLYPTSDIGSCECRWNIKCVVILVGLERVEFLVTRRRKRNGSLTTWQFISGAFTIFLRAYGYWHRASCGTQALNLSSRFMPFTVRWLLRICKECIPVHSNSLSSCSTACVVSRSCSTALYHFRIAITMYGLSKL
jgi:hypothetical protein